MTSTKILARNSAINVIGLIAPLIVAVASAPVLIGAIGSSRFAVLTLVWAVIGYFSLFDLGIGRALTQAVSEALGQNDSNRLREVTGIAITAMVLLGVVATIVVAAVSPWLTYRVLNVDEALRPEVVRSFRILAFSLPFVLCTGGFRGLLEAHQEFGLVNALRTPYLIFNFVGPLLIIPFSRSLVPMVGTLAVGRVVICAAHVVVCAKRYPWLREASTRNVDAMLPLIRLGGWMTVSNIVNPMLIYVDRFVIGAMLTLAAVAYYVTPFEVVVRFLFIPGAVLGVLFPAFASSYQSDRNRAAAIFDRATRFMLFTMFPGILALAVFAREGLQIWMGPINGPEYAQQSTVVVQLIAAGVLINSLGQIPQSFLQAMGRADLTARLHLAEIPIYGIALLLLTPAFGINGVAFAWTFRVVIDTAVNAWMAGRRFPEVAASVKRSLAWLAALLVALAAVSVPHSLIVRAMMASGILSAFLAGAWVYLLLEPERAMVRSVFRGRSVNEAA